MHNPYFFHPAPAAHYVPGILHAPPYHTAPAYIKPLADPVPNGGFNLPETVHFGIMPSDQVRQAPVALVATLIRATGAGTRVARARTPPHHPSERFG